MYIIVTFDVYIYPKGNQEIFPNGLNEAKIGTFLTSCMHSTIKYQLSFRKYVNFWATKLLFLACIFNFIASIIMCATDCYVYNKKSSLVINCIVTSQRS